MLLDQLAEVDRYFLLDSVWVVDMARDAEQLRARVTLTAHRRKLVAAAAHNSRYYGDGLDVSDGAGAAEDADRGRERRLKTGLAGFTLEGFDKGGLLAVDIGTRTAVEVDVVVIAAAIGVFADLARLVGFVNSALEDGRFVVELPTDIDIGRVSVYCPSDN